MLMMVANDGQHQTQGPQRTADVFTRQRVALHHRPFFRREIRAFFQDFIRDRNLSQVVQVSAAAKGRDFVILKMEVTAQIAGVLRKPFAMAFGIWIAALNAQAQRAENALRSFEFIGELLEFKQRFNARK